MEGSGPPALGCSPATLWAERTAEEVESLQVMEEESRVPEERRVTTALEGLER